MSNPIAEFLKSSEDRKRLLEIEQLRRQGERFIKVKYIGSMLPVVDSEGVCYNIRIHGLRDIEAYEQTNINNGKNEWKGRKGARVAVFRQSQAGDIEADIWDDADSWNRHFIANHPDELYVVDDKLRSEIEEEQGKPFKVELSRKEELEREISEKLQELDVLTKNENGKKRGRKRTSDNGGVNGIDESTSGVDSSGVSRVATGGD